METSKRADTPDYQQRRLTDPLRRRLRARYVDWSAAAPPTV
ncbi:MAG: hypothetical protein ACRDVE_07025 [Actinocrinis sp.]